MKIRNRHILLLDAVLLGVSPFLVYALRFDGWHWDPAQLATAITFAELQLPLTLAICFAFGMYRRLWRYASIAELELIGLAGATVAVANTLLGLVILPRYFTPTRVPLSVLFGYGLLTIFILAAPRLFSRVAGWRTRAQKRRRTDVRRTLIAGAGAAGEMILKELIANSDLGIEPVGFIDDDRTKHGLKLAGIPVLGRLADLERINKKWRAEELIIAMPRASGAVVREVVRAAYAAGLKTRTVPGLFEILSDRVRVSAIREVQIEDLLRRDPIETDLASVSSMATGKTVLVTGAGGSIGSELCRQLIALQPSRLVLLGHGENEIFEISQELRELSHLCELVQVIADIRDAERIRRVFTAYRPFAVFHAAAHKHVPLMEENVVEAITNNVLGTSNVVAAAVACGAKHFVLISSDKAVRPSNIMGATKRIAEHVVHQAAVKHHRNFVAVRFGNVLGSRGSVVPTFVRQIKAGGPVTVTDPEMRRYFMTIPEAVQLVLQAGALGKGGEVFLLDMGEPVRIVDLARDMIRLSGLREGDDIEIQFTGRRAGEKLYEEMFFSHEVAEATNHPKILRARNGQEGATEDAIQRLTSSARRGVADVQLRRMLKQLVPDFTWVDTGIAAADEQDLDAEVGLVAEAVNAATRRPPDEGLSQLSA
jgi:FlaA1/EpsC-like NDP-sugar epimerase